MKKILGVIAGVSLLGLGTHMAFAQLSATSIGGSVNTVTETSISADTKTTSTETSTTDTTSTTITTTATPIAPATVKLAPLTADISLEGSDTVTTGTRNVFITTNREVVSVEVRLKQNDAVELYLGQAHYDAAKARWVFAWDTTMRTPDGSYQLFAVAVASDDVVAHSDMVGVLVGNEKLEEPSGLYRSGEERTFVENALEENEREKTEITKDLSNIVTTEAAQKQVVQPVSERTQMRGIPVPQKPTPIDFEKVINEKSLDIKDALEMGDGEKRKEIIADIVRTAHGIPAGAPIPKDSEEFAKKVEESVLRLEQVMIEEERGVVDEKTFKVEAVQVAEVATRPDGTQTASKIAFRGKALPDSFVTLYIFSIPIVVTVKSDSEGNWDYTLDKELEDGSHQVYVGITDVKGKVVVRSNPVPFVKTASAITVEEALATPVAQAAPSFVENNYFYGIVTIIIMIVAFIFVFLGIKMSKSSENPIE